MHISFISLIYFLRRSTKLLGARFSHIYMSLMLYFKICIIFFNESIITRCSAVKMSIFLEAEPTIFSLANCEIYIKMIHSAYVCTTTDTRLSRVYDNCRYNYP